jgi:mRNA-degrading endonuclease toxin of MazEF toxin-antitoxin module
MPKDFNSWNTVKQNIEATHGRKFYHERDVWWCSLGVNVGSEQDGTGVLHDRPVLVLRAFGRNTCFVVPLSSSSKTHPLRVPVGSIQDRVAVALVSQMRVIDTKRLIYKVGRIDSVTSEAVRKAVKDLL